MKATVSYPVIGSIIAIATLGLLSLTRAGLISTESIIAAQPNPNTGSPSDGIPSQQLATSSSPSDCPTPTAPPPAAAAALASSGSSTSGKESNYGPSEGYLRTSGAQLLDASGREVRLTGLSWFGMETRTFAPHGLWSRNWEEMLDQVVAIGFNTLRLPFSSQLFDPDSKPNGIDFQRNPDLAGLNGPQIMDRIVDGAGQRGIRVILDRHRPDADGQSELWYTERYPESRWIGDWEMLAKRYKNSLAVIGADLHNEPHGPATWGTGETRNDWRLAAERAGNAILAVNPNWLVVVEGVERHEDDYYWWGGNLKAAGDLPVRLNVPGRLVYSPHDYGPGVYNQRWFLDSDFPNNLSRVWDDHWGYLAKQNQVPILLGEFGGRSVGTDREGVWQRTLLAYLKEHRLNYTYWTLNPNSGDTGGVLADDWVSVDKAKLAALAAYQWPLFGKLGPVPH